MHVQYSAYTGVHVQYGAYTGVHEQCSAGYACHVVMMPEFLREILKNREMSNFIKIRSVGTEWRGRQTDRHTGRHVMELSD